MAAVTEAHSIESIEMRGQAALARVSSYPYPGMTEPSIETIAECVEAALTTQPRRVRHVVVHDVPVLLREIIRLRAQIDGVVGP